MIGRQAFNIKHIQVFQMKLKEGMTTEERNEIVQRIIIVKKEKLEKKKGTDYNGE